VLIRGEGGPYFRGTVYGYFALERFLIVSELSDNYSGFDFTSV